MVDFPYKVRNLSFILICRLIFIIEQIKKVREKYIIYTNRRVL